MYPLEVLVQLNIGEDQAKRRDLDHDDLSDEDDDSNSFLDSLAAADDTSGKVTG